MKLAHQIRLNPTHEQEVYFRRACGTARFTYNWALNQWNQQHAQGKKPKANELKKQFNAVRHVQFPWSGEVHRDCTSQPFANLNKAFSRFFKKQTRYPVYKKKGDRDSFYVANDKIRFEGKVVRLPVIGYVKLREFLRLNGKVLSATVSRKANRWLLSVQVDVGAKYTKTHAADRALVVGVDLGVKHLATLSTGEKIEGPKALGKSLKRLRLLQKSVSRKIKGSNNRRKAKDKVARIHIRAVDVRKDALHKLTTRLCRENQAVVVEDLDVKEMVQCRNLSRRVSDQGFYEFRRQLTYKAEIYGSKLVVADRWFPSSKRCFSCGKVKALLLLSEREYCCDFCGAKEDRDVNAARNLEQLGWATADVKPADKGALAGSQDSVKQLWMKQESRGEHLCAPKG